MSFLAEPWLSVAKAFGSVVAFAITLSEKKRAKVANFLDEVAKSLEGIASDVDADRDFSSNCVKLETYAGKLHDLCQSVSPASDLLALTSRLNLAATTPSMLSQQAALATLSGVEKAAALQTLRNAAAHFTSYATVLRTK